MNSGDKGGSAGGLRMEPHQGDRGRLFPEESMPENIRADYKNIGGTPHLDGAYTVFGEVISGMDTVRKFRMRRPDAPIVKERIYGSFR